jgi:RHS repeat-associated protein
VRYFFSDHLGSMDVVTNATGSNIQEESDYYPYGGERVIIDNLSGQRYKFTGKERDSESGLDNFGARYYSSSLGRFLSVDPSDLLPCFRTKLSMICAKVSGPLFL